MTTTLPPVGVPAHGIGAGVAYLRFWRGFVRFSGRSSRSEMWWPFAINALLLTAANVVLELLFGNLGRVRPEPTVQPDDFTLATALGAIALMVGLFALVMLPITLPTYAVMTRRLRDGGFPPLLLLLGLVGLVIVPLVLCAMPSRAPAPGQGFAAP